MSVRETSICILDLNVGKGDKNQRMGARMLVRNLYSSKHPHNQLMNLVIEDSTVRRTLICFPTYIHLIAISCYCSQLNAVVLVSHITKVLLKNITGLSQSRNLPYFIQHAGLLSHSETLATFPNPASHQSSPFHIVHFLNIRFNIIFPTTPRSLKLYYFPSDLPTELCTHLTCLPHVPHVPPIPLF
jgi:hypothetical protein